MKLKIFSRAHGLRIRITDTVPLRDENREHLGRNSETPHGYARVSGAAERCNGRGQPKVRPRRPKRTESRGGAPTASVISVVAL